MAEESQHIDAISALTTSGCLSGIIPPFRVQSSTREDRGISKSGPNTDPTELEMPKDATKVHIIQRPAVAKHILPATGFSLLKTPPP